MTSLHKPITFNLEDSESLGGRRALACLSKRSTALFSAVQIIGANFSQDARDNNILGSSDNQITAFNLAVIYYKYESD